DLTPPKASNADATPARPAARNQVTARDTKHRSVYLGIVRGAPLPESLSLFDVANPNVLIAQREETTVPAQALYLMNSPFIIDQSKSTAQRLLDNKECSDAERIDLAYRLCYARPATPAEKERATKYLADTAKELGGKQGGAWASFSQVLIPPAEFRYMR